MQQLLPKRLTTVQSYEAAKIEISDRFLRVYPDPRRALESSLATLYRCENVLRGLAYLLCLSVGGVTAHSSLSLPFSSAVAAPKIETHDRYVLHVVQFRRTSARRDTRAL